MLKPHTAKCFEWLSKEVEFKDKLMENVTFEHDKFHDLNCMMHFMKDIFADDDEGEMDAAHTSLSPELKLHQCCRALANCFDSVPPNDRSERAIRSLWNLLLRSIHVLEYPFTLASLLPTRPSKKFSEHCHKNLCELLMKNGGKVGVNF